MNFKGSVHKRIFTREVAGCRAKNIPYYYLAALFLLTSSNSLWQRASMHINPIKINWKAIDIRGVSVQDYALIDDEPRAILTPERETVRQQGRRIKEPNEEMFTITAQDRHGIVHKGRVRRLMPIECFRLQGYSDSQFNTVQSLGISDCQLYKMAGNSISVPVVSAIGEKIKAVADSLNLFENGVKANETN